MRTYKTFYNNIPKKKKIYFIIGDWNAKGGSQEIPGIMQIWPWSIERSRAKSKRVLPKECTLGSQQTPSSNNTRDDSTHGHHQMVNTEIRLLIFFAAKDGDALYSQQKQARELTVTQIMNSLLPNSD